MICISLLGRDAFLMAGIRHILSSPEVSVITLNQMTDIKPVTELIKTDILVMEAEGQDYTSSDTLKLIYRSFKSPAMPAIVLVTRSDNPEMLYWKKIFPGLPVLSEEVRPHKLKKELLNALQSSVQCRLSPREFQVLHLLCKGFTQQQASYIMNISPKTVCSQRKSLQQKMRCSGKPALNRLISTFASPVLKK